MIEPLFRTERLEVVALTAETARAATEDRGELARILEAQVDPDWPLPDFAEYLPVMARTLDRDPDLMAYGGVMVLRSTRIVVGEVGLHGAPVDGIAEVGYSVVPSWRGRGLASEALRGLVEWSRDILGIQRLAARCYPDNLASRGVLRKAGFRFVSGPDREDLLHYLLICE